MLSSWLTEWTLRYICADNTKIELNLIILGEESWREHKEVEEKEFWDKNYSCNR